MSLRRGAMLCFALVLAAGACGSTVPPEARGREGIGGTIDRDPVATDAEPGTPTADEAIISDNQGIASAGGVRAGTRAAAATSGSRLAATTAGVPSAPLKLGIVIEEGDPGASFGLSSELQDQEPLARGIVEEVNATGGIAGRPVDPVIVKVDQSDQSEGNQIPLQTAACVKLTEDAKVFMVLSVSNTAVYAYDCYAKHHTPIVDFAAVGGDDDVDFAVHRPWVMPPLVLSGTRYAKVLPKVLAEQGFMTQKVGVVSFDQPRVRRTAKLLIDGINRSGGKVVEEVYMQISYDGVAAGSANAILKFRQAGVDRVVMWAGGGGAWLIFAQAAESQGYRPRYGISTIDNPRTVAPLLAPEQLAGATGLGYWTARDLSDDAQPPTTPQEAACFKVMNARAGTQETSRQIPYSNDPLMYCESFGVLRAALAPAAGKELRQEQVQSYFYALGSSYEPIQFDRARYVNGQTDGIAAYAHLAYDQNCACFKYRSKWLDLVVP